LRSDDTSMLFGSTDIFFDISPWSFRMGLPVANEDFIKALLTYGTYDEYEFFCPDAHIRTLFLKKIENCITDPVLASRIKASTQICLADSIKARGYDIFHLGSFVPQMAPLSAIRNRYAKNQFPITGITHSLDSPFMVRLYDELFSSGIRSYDSIICTSTSSLQAISKVVSFYKVHNAPSSFDEPRLAMIPLGIDNDFFVEYDKSSAKKCFKIPETLTVALSVGRLSPFLKKDWTPILEYLGRMVANGLLRNFFLIIAGGGEQNDKELLCSLIEHEKLQDHVMVIANFEPAMKVKLYQAADFYISLVDNYQETFGLSVLEAMAAGLPVIVSDFSGYRDMVRNGENGFLVDTVQSAIKPGFLMQNMGIISEPVAKFYNAQNVAVDMEQFHKALLYLYDNSANRKRMGLNSRERAKEYQWQKIIQQYEDYWEELMLESRVHCKTKENARKIIYQDYYSHIFSHFTTRILTENSIVSITDFGRRLLQDKNLVFRYEDITLCIDERLEQLLLTISSCRIQALKTIKEQTLEKYACSEEKIEFHIIWLAKHGALCISDS
jgi:glycosyltransferase involved in cell wall biosynthesis